MGNNDQVLDYLDDFEAPNELDTNHKPSGGADEKLEHTTAG